MWVKYKPLSSVETVEIFPEGDNIILNSRHTFQIPPIYNVNEKLLAICFTLVFTKRILLGWL